MPHRHACLSPTLVLASLFSFVHSASATALDEYVAAPDDHYAFVRVGRASYDESTLTTGHVLELTSQAWRDDSEVDHTIWRHWVTVVVPEGMIFLPPVTDTALLLIGDGDYDDPAPSIPSDHRQLAAATRTVIVELSAIPNLPLRFADQTGLLSEDEIVAYSWDKFLRTGDGDWPVQLPMVKAVVRCMDAVRSFVASGAGRTVRHFILSGGSKRGWAAWLTAAVDSRVKAIVPIASDLLNMRVSLPHHLGSYGDWAQALAPYEELGILDRLESSQGVALLRIVDPFEYRDRLTMPKFIINVTGDDFVATDTVQFYLRGLSGETYLRHVANADRSLTGVYDQIINGMAPYIHAIVNGNRRPRFSWSAFEDGSVRVEASDKPREVLLWQATNPSARDFRLTTIGAGWSSSPLADQGGGTYVAQVAAPASGWTAFFLELIYNNAFASEFASYGDFKYHFTTPVCVLPNVLPFPDAMRAPVYRFWSPVNGRHFYTMNEWEKQKLITVYPHVWTYEMVAYQGHLTHCDWGHAPVHRFWSDRLSTHFYTISDREGQKLIENYSHVWTYEGTAFYAYPESESPAGSLPVHRFWSPKHSSHFYTTSEREKNKLIDNFASVWSYEGIAWYVHPAED